MNPTSKIEIVDSSLAVKFHYSWGGDSTVE